MPGGLRYTGEVAVRVRVLGGLAVEGIDLSRLSSRKARRVLARLAVARGAPVAADALADVVWGDDQPSHPADQLAVLVSRLRSLLGADRITRQPAGYVLHADWLDLAALAELTAEARHRLDAGATAPAAAASLAALDLLRGQVLPEEPPETAWLEAERAEVARHAATARLVAAQAALAGGDPWRAAELADQAVHAEPYDEVALRVLMSAHERAGRPALALTAYARLAQRLADDLGVDPAPPTKALHLRLLRAEPVPADDPVAPLPGRAVELAALAAAYDEVRDGEVRDDEARDDEARNDEARDGRVRFIVVEGEPGIGKTRLLNDFVGGPRVGAATVLRCPGDEQAGGLPLQPLLDGLAAHLRAHPDPDAFAGAAAPLAALVDLPTTVVPTTFAAFAGNPETGLGLMFAALDTVLTRLAKGRPVVLVIDDAQWIDPATRAWLHHAGRRLTGVPLLVLAARRLGEGAAVPGDITLTLGRLSLDACAEALGLAADSPRARRLFERSGGHPMFLWELSQSAADALPASIRDSVRQRCERAGPAVAATVRAAAVLGPDVDLELLAAVLDQPVAELLDHLEDGVRRHLLVESSTGFRFAHQLVRDALGQATGVARIGLLHRQAARSLAARTNADPLAVAYHARLGGDPAAAATALARAADVAAARYDLDEALRLLDQAVALSTDPSVRLSRARIRLRTGDTAGAAADAREVREEPGSPSYAAALEVSALVSYVERDFARCVRLAEEGAAVTRDPEIRASCLALAARIRHATGDLAGAQETFSKVDAPASVAPLVDTWHGLLLVHADDPAAALRLVGADEPTRVRVGYPFVAINRHMVAGYALARQGDPLTALREFELMSATAARERTDRFAGRDENFRGWILRGLGAFGPADEANTRALELSTAQGSTEPMVHALLDLADGRLRANDPSGAATYLSKLDALTDHEYVFAWRGQLRASLVAGRFALATGSFVDAAEHFSTVLATADRLGLRRYQVLARLGLAQADRSFSIVDDDIVALDRVAPLESWWITADLARTFGVDAWRRLADSRLAALAARAGPYAPGLLSRSP
jgi:DNA-binding SARP family transcriptional activator/tetratricopeptide (TPR) repeat protein